MVTPPRFLMNNDSGPFDPSELDDIYQKLDSIADRVERERYRDDNARDIANNPAERILVVSGPGTGKSYLFLDRIRYWLTDDPNGAIFVISFVRKLIADLQADVKKLPLEQRERVEVSTLHSLARSIVERNVGKKGSPFKPFIKILVDQWQTMAWEDAMSFHVSLDPSIYTWKKFEKQLHTMEFDKSEKWKAIYATYGRLCVFYNAMGFADLIIRSIKVLSQAGVNKEADFFIIDEHQDFNRAEEVLIQTLTKGAKGLLIAGDDDQVLYEELKSGKADIIRSHYYGTDDTNAMLPFCGRCSHHVVKTAESFIAQVDDGSSIKKLFLPIDTDHTGQRVQVIGCITPSAAADYILRFIQHHQTEIEARKKGLQKGEEKDPFLMVLVPGRKKLFLSKYQEVIDKIMEYKTTDASYSEDFIKVITYRSLAEHPEDNFIFRKVMYYEGVQQGDVYQLLTIALSQNLSFYQIDSDIISSLTDKVDKVRVIMDGDLSPAEKSDAVGKLLTINDIKALAADVEKYQDDRAGLLPQEVDEESAEKGASKMSALELLTIVGSKGLSADHVMILGFDDVNMTHITRNAFYVAMTRARKSLHMFTARGSRGAQMPHGFLEHLPESNVEFYIYKKGKADKEQMRNKASFVNRLDYYNKTFRKRV